MAEPKQEQSKKLRAEQARKLIENIRTNLVEATSGCAIQQSACGEKWPCGTCVCAVLGEMLARDAAEHSQHNDPVDRINEVWRAILQMRDFPTNSS